ncbi:hypothetical protein [Moritella sp. F3]|uniref:hypothetical protein n=1 Tax=Moritella sp. F3 TaxID=2718882 RepID=UPI0018E19AC4|nr:hypothetical protein [Moritella sp. F3]GIC77195.1 hypothetical protein FMO001_19220 [Moritella sp. F1]GIC82314.1 hypothetical protein FMO003_25950 [Moritella sp. F3]
MKNSKNLKAFVLPTASRWCEFGSITSVILLTAALANTPLSDYIWAPMLISVMLVTAVFSFLLEKSI